MATTTTLLKEPNAEPIPGYRLIEPIGRGGYGEVWKCVAPGGLFKAIKFVPGPQDELDTSPGAAAEELKSVQRIKAIRHPFLLSMERVEDIQGELVIVMELADKSLKDLLDERQAAGRSGIDRAEVLAYLREAADVLDLMSTRHNLQHLDIKPANLFLVCDHVKVADFGLVQSLSERTGQTPASPLGAVTPRYAAPELFRGKVTATSDQYSLALVYQELVTGGLPFGGKNFRQLMLQHMTAEPNLSALPEADRPIVARALQKDAAARFPSCREFIQALTDCDRAAPEPSAADTTDALAAQTQIVPPAVGTLLPDLQFMGCLGRTPTGEAWSARAASGKSWVVNVLYGALGRNARQNDEGIARLEAMAHPALPARRVVLGDRGCVIVATELVELNLRARYQECRVRGGNGVPQRELLDRLHAAASALDQLFEQHGLPHLGLNPRNLLLDGERTLIGEYGLLPVLYHAAGQMRPHLQTRYAAPEVLDGQTGRAADVYSLAVIYQEMLTGTHPFRGKPASRGVEPALEALPAADRAAIARALDVDPARRFGCGGEFLMALAGPNRGGARATSDDSLSASSTESVADITLDRTPDPAARLARLIDEAAAATPAVSAPEWQTAADGGTVLQSRLCVSLPPSGALAKFEGFRRQWQAQLLAGDDRSAVFQITPSRNLWQRLRGAQATLAVEVTWTRAQPPTVPLPEVIARVRVPGRKDAAAESLLKEHGPTILESLHKQFLGSHERRAKVRVLWARPVQVTFLGADGQAGETIECQGKDLSLTGMGLYLPCALAGSDVRLNLTPEQPDDPTHVTGQFVRVQRCGGGWYEAGVLFQ